MNWKNVDFFIIFCLGIHMILPYVGTLPLYLTTLSRATLNRTTFSIRTFSSMTSTKMTLSTLKLKITEKSKNLNSIRWFSKKSLDIQITLRIKGLYRQAPFKMHDLENVSFFIIFCLHIHNAFGISTLNRTTLTI
jgi:hypothetical protein